MNKFQLTQGGILALQRLLYELPDSKLAIEVLALRTDFKQWIKTKFELQRDELDFIDELNSHFSEYAAIKLSNFIAQRKPIQFSVIEFKPKLTQTAIPTPCIPQ
ncbi:hypothetical protein WG904_12285 [Pedobacter sp. Du54]|uniref:hypothetical protein n=1 Tax=Pedobacter anseongensis TaxID=3133439 RepID=UPI00309FF8D1